MSRRMWDLDMTFIASDEEMATPSKPSGQPALIVDVPCPECMTEAVAVPIDVEGDVDGATGSARPCYYPGTPGRCTACGHELTPAEAEMAKDSAKRVAKEGG